MTLLVRLGNYSYLAFVLCELKQVNVRCHKAWCPVNDKGAAQYFYLPPLQYLTVFFISLPNCISLSLNCVPLKGKGCCLVASVSLDFCRLAHREGVSKYSLTR